MSRNTDYFYKGYDITNKSRLEKMQMEFSNPYGYNFESNLKRVKDESISSFRTTQDLIKSKDLENKK